MIKTNTDKLTPLRELTYLFDLGKKLHKIHGKKSPYVLKKERNRFAEIDSILKIIDFMPLYLEELKFIFSSLKDKAERFRNYLEEKRINYSPYLIMEVFGHNSLIIKKIEVSHVNTEIVPPEENSQYCKIEDLLSSNFIPVPTYTPIINFSRPFQFQFFLDVSYNNNFEEEYPEHPEPQNGYTDEKQYSSYPFEQIGNFIALFKNRIKDIPNKTDFSPDYISIMSLANRKMMAEIFLSDTDYNFKNSSEMRKEAKKLLKLIKNYEEGDYSSDDDLFLELERITILMSGEERDAIIQLPTQVNLNYILTQKNLSFERFKEIIIKELSCFFEKKILEEFIHAILIEEEEFLLTLTKTDFIFAGNCTFVTTLAFAEASKKNKQKVKKMLDIYKKHRNISLKVGNITFDEDKLDELRKKLVKISFSLLEESKNEKNAKVRKLPSENRKVA